MTENSSLFHISSNSNEYQQINIYLLILPISRRTGHFNLCIITSVIVVQLHNTTLPPDMQTANYGTQRAHGMIFCTRHDPRHVYTA